MAVCAPFLPTNVVRDHHAPTVRGATCATQTAHLMICCTGTIGGDAGLTDEERASARSTLLSRSDVLSGRRSQIDGPSPCGRYVSLGSASAIRPTPPLPFFS